jgi:hypothetical protein
MRVTKILAQSFCVPLFWFSLQNILGRQQSITYYYYYYYYYYHHQSVFSCRNSHGIEAPKAQAQFSLNGIRADGSSTVNSILLLLQFVRWTNIRSQYVSLIKGTQHEDSLMNALYTSPSWWNCVARAAFAVTNISWNMCPHDDSKESILTDGCSECMSVYFTAPRGVRTPLSGRYERHTDAGFLAALFFKPEDTGAMLFRNVAWHQDTSRHL